MVNFEKMELSLSQNVLKGCQIFICEKVEVKVVKIPTKYLGLPTLIRKSKKHIFFRT